MKPLCWSFTVVQLWASHLTFGSIYYTNSQGHNNKVNCLFQAFTPKWDIRSSHTKLMIFPLYFNRQKQLFSYAHTSEVSKSGVLAHSEVRKAPTFSANSQVPSPLKHQRVNSSGCLILLRKEEGNRREHLKGKAHYVPIKFYLPRGPDLAQEL